MLAFCWRIGNNRRKS